MFCSNAANWFEYASRNVSSYYVNIIYEHMPQTLL